MITSWLNSLKVAIVNKDLLKIADLYKNIPDFENLGATVEQLEEAKSLIAQVIEVLKNKKDETKKVMDATKASITYQKNMK